MPVAVNDVAVARVVDPEIVPPALKYAQAGAAPTATEPAIATTASRRAFRTGRGALRRPQIPDRSPLAMTSPST
ncbi:hypothetical protein GCM10009547_10020 [Sporichthya brevicatena]|uniref:Uncharacterized protein n=1 Tax=Sporichthya brevicatena TaxID=171442 RepID=A0ABN1GEP0_9ACTN